MLVYSEELSETSVRICVICVSGPASFLSGALFIGEHGVFLLPLGNNDAEGVTVPSLGAGVSVGVRSRCCHKFSKPRTRTTGWFDVIGAVLLCYYDVVREERKCPWLNRCASSSADGGSIR